MTPATNAPPRFLSVDFHVRFFPSVLWRRLRPRGAGGESPFAYHGSLASLMILVVCAVLAALGLPSAVSRGSMVGGIIGALGVAGMLAMVVQSVHAQLGTRPTYDAFGVGVFLLFPVLGLTLGLVYASGLHSRAIEAGAAAAGVVIGYPLGILGGLGVQHLGWFAMPVNLAAWLVALAMLLVDLTKLA